MPIHRLVYGLLDPRTQEVRYVGKSSWGMARPRGHVLPSVLSKDNSAKAAWLHELLALNLLPVVRVFEVVDTLEALNAREIAWIKHGEDAGWPLLNMTFVSKGAPRAQALRESRTVRMRDNAHASIVRHTDEHKAALSERMKGNQYALGSQRSDASKQALSAQMKGNSYAKGWAPTPEWRLKQSERMKANRYAAGRVIPDEERLRRTASVRAAYATWTPEQRAAHVAKISAGKQRSEGNLENLKKGWTPEAHAKAIAASAALRRGTHQSDETKRKISEANKRAYAEGRRKPRIASTTWATKYDRCVTCHTTERPHKARGNCSRCHDQTRVRTLDL